MADSQGIPKEAREALMRAWVALLQERHPGVTWVPVEHPQDREGAERSSGHRGIHTDELENAVTCDRAELGLSKQLDGRISRKERKRLDDHLTECPSCSRLRVTQGKQRRAFKGLALLPLPLSLTLFKGAPSAGAAIGIPTIGAVGTAAVVTSSAATGGAATGGGFALGGLALGSVAVKAAAVVTAVSVASGVGYVGTKEVRDHRGPARKTPVTDVTPASTKTRPASAGGAERSASPTARGKAHAKGSARATSPTGSGRGATAPGRTGSASRKAVGAKPNPTKRTVRPPKPERKPVPAAATRAPAKAKPASAKAAAPASTARTVPARKVATTSAPVTKTTGKTVAATKPTASGTSSTSPAGNDKKP